MRVEFNSTRMTKSPKVKIDVSEEIIGNACQRTSHHCMIAESIKNHNPDFRNVSVDLMTIRFSDPENGMRYTYNTPPNARHALALFDSGVKPAPFVLHLKDGHATSMRHGDKLVHKLGRSKVSTTLQQNGGLEVSSVGGVPIPHPKPKHLSHHTVRVFGLRSFTKGWEFHGEEGVAKD